METTYPKKEITIEGVSVNDPFNLLILFTFYSTVFTVNLYTVCLFKDTIQYSTLHTVHVQYAKYCILTLNVQYCTMYSTV